MVEEQPTTPVEPTAPTEPNQNPPEQLLNAEAPRTEEPTGEAKPAEGEVKKPEEKLAEFKVSDLKIPEGVTLVEGSLDKFAPIATDLGLTQDQSQKLLDFHIQTLKDANQANYTAYETMQNKWRDEVRADSEIGGDKTQGVTSTVSKALAEYGTPKVREALSLTGAGNNPEIIKTFYRMAKALTEGGLVKGNPPSPPQEKGASALYPNLKP